MRSSLTSSKFKSKKRFMLPQVEEILAIFKKHGELNYGESMSVLSHSIQSGLIARDLGLPDSILVAAYLHDIGHICPLFEGVKNSMMDGYGLNEHDLLGAHFLERKGFDETVTIPIRNHVASKRYLCLKTIESKCHHLGLSGRGDGCL